MASQVTSAIFYHEGYCLYHNAACGRLGIKMPLRIVKFARNEEEQEDDEDNLPHGTKVLNELVMPWANKYRIIFTDSYFTSVPAAE